MQTLYNTACNEHKCLYITFEKSPEEAPRRYSRTGVEEFLADGVFVFYYGKVRDIRMRAVEILKLRGAKHVNKIVPFHITDKGLEVFPGERIFEVE